MTSVLKIVPSSFDLTEGRRVLTLEAQALSLLSESLDASFTQAIDVLLSPPGHVAVTGMGKSGHIARKIASTLSSTGTFSFFIHPAEASHGDLGMLSQGDKLIALSNSGETPELSDLITFAHRQNIPIIALTSHAQSMLAKMAHVVLALPKVDEACPLGLAPTTTTTLMLALGDALAIALLKRRGFSAEDFGTLHPGGKLGQRLLQVEQIMRQGDALPLVSSKTTMQDALILISAKGAGCVGVLNAQGNLIGMITDGDIRRHMGANFLSKKVTEVMTEEPHTISSKALVVDALTRMNDNGITSLFVLEASRNTQKPVGLIHIHDCLKAGLS